MTNRERAEILYFQSGFTQKQIADILNVSDQAVTKWAQAGKWAQKRAEDAQTKKNAEARLNKLLEHQLMLMEMHVDEALSGSRPMAPLEKDDINILVKLRGMFRSKDSFGVLLSCQNEYMAFMKTHFPEQAKVIIPANQHFIAQKLKEYQG